MDQIEPNERARDTFVRVRQSRRFLSVYDMPACLAEALPPNRGGPGWIRGVRE